MIYFQGKSFKFFKDLIYAELKNTKYDDFFNALHLSITLYAEKVKNNLNLKIKKLLKQIRTFECKGFDKS